MGSGESKNEKEKMYDDIYNSAIGKVDKKKEKKRLEKEKKEAEERIRKEKERLEQEQKLREETERIEKENEEKRKLAEEAKLKEEEEARKENLPSVGENECPEGMDEFLYKDMVELPWVYKSGSREKEVNFDKFVRLVTTGVINNQTRIFGGDLDDYKRYELCKDVQIAVKFRRKQMKKIEEQKKKSKQ